MSKTFSVESDSEDWGKVKKKMLSIRVVYNWVDSNGIKIATGKKALISWGAKIDIFDCQDNKIGTIQEQVFKSLIKARTKYSILDKSGQKIAESVKVSIGATSITINREGREVAQLNRPWLRINDQWSGEIYDHGAVDSRLLIMMGVFKTDADN